MPWQDRIREAAYTSPSGVRLAFQYEDVSKTVDKKTTAFEFPDSAGTYVQDLGHTGRRFPLRLFLWGGDYDQAAAEFEAALLETGVGRLEHPVYGVVDVVPFGTITRRDDLKTAANQAVLEVTFWETTGLAYPTAGSDPASAVAQAVEAFNVAVAEEFESEVTIDSAVTEITLRSTYTATLDAAREALQTVADAQASVKAKFDAVYASINEGIDVLVRDPLTLAAQTITLIQAPAVAALAVQDRLNAYRSLAENLISGPVSQTQGTVQASNEFHTRDVSALTAVTGQILSVVNNQFETRGDALSAAEEVLSLFAAVNAWREPEYAALGETDVGGEYQALQAAAATAAGYLVEISFSLKQERSVVLDRARTLVDLVAELYGTVDEELDFFIQSNDLSGSEILELPEGRRVVYYV